MNEIKSLKLKDISCLSLSMKFALIFTFPYFNLLRFSSQAYLHLLALRTHLHSKLLTVYCTSQRKSVMSIDGCFY